MLVKHGFNQQIIALIPVEKSLIFWLKWVVYMPPKKICLIKTCALIRNSFFYSDGLLTFSSQCWIWSGSQIAIQPDSAIQNQIRIGLDFEKTQPDQIWINPNCIDHCCIMLNQSFFGYKADWIKYLDRSTGLGSDQITQWKFWTGLWL